MPSKDFWKKATEDFVNDLKKVNKNTETEIMGKIFTVMPGVFSPAYSTDTRWFAERMVPIIGKSTFLEIGTGTGVIACLAVLNGAKVIATDINPQAIENTKLNQKNLGINFEIRLGSVFSPIKENEKFDVIFWNHPFNYTDDKVNDMLTASVFDEKYSDLKRYFIHAKEHLLPQGKLLLGTGNIARINLIKKMAKEQGYELKLLEKIEVPVYEGQKVNMDLRLYQLGPLV
jgi:release factor glutamine methyltransferase